MGERISGGQKEQDKDILSLLLRGGVRDQETLVNQMMTMLAAGHDTSGLSLAWACYVLARHQGVQARLRDEIRASSLPIWAGDDTESGDAQSVHSLEYLQAVANEILRLYPAVPVTRREALEDTTVQGYFIPEASHMVASGWITNRIETEWGPQAEEFRPDRWMEVEENDNTLTHAFSSFSHGPRACIGQGLARAEFLVFLAALTGNFKPELKNPEKEPEVLYGITMSPAGGIEIRLRAID